VAGRRNRRQPSVALIACAIGLFLIAVAVAHAF